MTLGKSNLGFFLRPRDAEKLTSVYNEIKDNGCNDHGHKWVIIQSVKPFHFTKLSFSYTFWRVLSITTSKVYSMTNFSNIQITNLKKQGNNWL